MNTETGIQYGLHNVFIISKYNVRQNRQNDDVSELKATIHSAGGILQNLVVYRQMKKGKPTGILEIVGGGRRWTALGQLIEEGKIAANYLIAYLVVSEDVAIEMSLTENAGREPMHPADEFDAMQLLVAKGRSITDVAAAFGLEQIVVKRRLKLANVSPALLQLYREDKIDLEQLEALAIVDDHARQEQVWQSLPNWNRRPHNIRQALTANNPSTKDALARFVGVAAYKKAGGNVITDLFSEGEAGYVDNLPLLESMALKKLKKHEQPLLDEGFKWVDIYIRADYSLMHSYGKPRVTRREPTEGELAVKTQLETEQEQYDRDYAESDGDDDDDAIFERGEILEAKWEAYYQTLEVVHAEDLELVGALVTINSEGKVDIRKNLIRPDDIAKIKRSKSESGSGVAKVKLPHSEKLTRNLTAHRTIALQAEVMHHPDVALAVMLTRLIPSVIGDGYCGETMLKIRLETFSHHSDAPELSDSSAFKAMEAQRQLLADRLPKNAESEELFAFLLTQDQSFLMELFAFCIAAGLNTVQAREEESDFYLVAKAVNLDMMNWWTPTQTNYFKLISRAYITDIVSATVSADAAIPLQKMKKDVAAAEAERLLTPAKWLPSLMQVS